MQNFKKNTPGHHPSSGIDLTHYLRLLKREKWLILIIFISVFFVWLLLAFNFGPKSIYNTSALLQFEDRRTLSGLDDRGRPENEAKIGILMSRNFLGKVVDRLSMPIVFWDVERTGVVDSLALAKNYVYGDYILIKSEEILQLYYSNSKKGIEKQKVEEVPLSSETVLKHGGMELYLNESYWDKNDKLSFSLIKREQAIESLRKSLLPSFENRIMTLLRVTINGNDRHYITEILNVLVEEFTIQNLDYKKTHTREVLSILSEQLETAQGDLDKTTQELKVFRQKNPWVGLTPGTNNIVNNLTSSETKKISIETNKNELNRLVTRLRASSGEPRYNIMHEILSFLNSQNVPTAPALLSEYNELSTERERILPEYSPLHEVVQKNTSEFNELEKRVLSTVDNQYAMYVTQLGQVDSDISQSNYQIRNLPAKELQLAEFHRKKAIADEVCTSLLVRYNQAKIADAVEVSDILVLDPAIVPESGSKIQIYFTYILIGIVLGIGISFGFVIVKDIFNKTVFTADELEKIIPIKVVAKIPVIGEEEDYEYEHFGEGIRIDPKLVTADYSPTPVGEAYRNLRTQILFNTNDKKIKSLFVTSLNPNEGKSLNASNLAVTFAQQKLPTLLIDADLRRGVLHHSFACKKKPGLSDFIYSNADINDENLRKIIQQTHIPNLHLLSSGRPIPNPSEILGTPRSREVIEFIKSRFGFVFIDTPPINITADSIIISQYVDGGLFVVQAGKTNTTLVKEKISEYGEFSKKITGIVLNFAEYDIKSDHYKYSYYNY